MFPRLPARAQHLLRTQILCPGHKKCFWFCSETFCVCSKCFPVCAAWKHNIHFVSRAFACPRNIMSNNVSSFASTFKKSLFSAPTGNLSTRCTLLMLLQSTNIFKSLETPQAYLDCKLALSWQFPEELESSWWWSLRFQWLYRVPCQQVVPWPVVKEGYRKEHLQHNYVKNHCNLLWKRT